MLKIVMISLLKMVVVDVLKVGTRIYQGCPLLTWIQTWYRNTKKYGIKLISY